jgi:hypothetical protein
MFDTTVDFIARLHFSPLEMTLRLLLSRMNPADVLLRARSTALPPKF